jgi:UDP-N-acetylmuramoylalanine--D-glutamate ligase
MGRIRDKIEQGRTLVMGLGKSGLAAVRFLLAQGADVAVSEFKARETVSPEILSFLDEKGVLVEFGGHSPALFTGVDLIIVSPGVPLDLPVLQAAQKANVEIIGELGLTGDYLQTPVVAITGTNGKTTVTTIIAELLRAGNKKVFMGGNIGTPLAEYLLTPQEADVAVLEVSSFQLDTAGDFRPEVGVLLNITPDHLERYDSFAHYAQAKLKIFAHQQQGDKMVVNSDDPEIITRLADFDFAGEPYYFGRSVQGDGAVSLNKKVVLSLPSGKESYSCPSRLTKSPNRENCLAAILAARLMHCLPDGIAAGLAGFQPLPHRLSLVAEIYGVSYINDSKATNEGAVLTALAAIAQPVILIAGGRGKGGGYQLLRPVVAERVKKLLLIGEAQREMADAFAGLVPVEECESLDFAVRRAALLAEKGDVVLLSPACASFDQFSGYEERGRVFEQVIREFYPLVQKQVA